MDESRIITDQDRSTALQVKADANKAFVTKEFGRSIELYTEAIALNPKEPTFWNNRAMSKGKMEEHGGAISDASELASLRDTYPRTSRAMGY